MSNTERARAQAEARRLQPGMTSADRTRFWSGLNRYLSSEAEHAHKAAEQDEEGISAPTSDETPSQPREK